MDLDEIREAFAFFDGWEDKYRFVIDLGKDLPNLDDAHKVPANLVRGCQSQVWLLTELRGGRMRFAVDSDAQIVRGLIAIMLTVFQNRTPDEVRAFDIEGLFAELELIKHLTPTRGNGLRAMVARIHQEAERTALD
ncbi:MAG: SufE family protein [Gammaproteobacteria bacterium]|nr:SufE family protein [Gammaproteobacteria bacterium]